METVVNIAAGFAQKWDSKIEHIVLEGKVLNEEIDIKNLKLRPCKEVSKDRSFFALELCCKWSFEH